jgi:outer membrane protein TolC
MKRIFHKLILLTIFSILSACSDYFSQEEIYQNQVLDSVKLEASTGNAKFKVNWWHDYDSAELNSFVEEALKQNLTLKIAKARVKEAKAKARQYDADRYPEVGLSYSSSRTNSSSGVSSSESYSLKPSYEVDLWGANYSLYKSYEHEAIAQEYMAKSAAMTLISEVVSTWLKIKFGQQQAIILHDQLDLYQNLLQYQVNNFTAGAMVDQEILANQNLVNSYQTKIYQNLIKVDGLKLELEYLLGRSPNENISISNDKMPEVIKLPKKGLSSELIYDRPDIVSAWYSLKASNWSLVSKKLQMLPTFDIAITFSDTALSSVLGNWTSIANNVAFTAMDWGRDLDGVDQSKAVFERMLSVYTDAVYKAVVDVRNQLIKNEHILEQISWSKKQLKLSEQQYKEALVNAENGGKVIDVIYKKVNVKNNELMLLNEQQQLNLYRVELYNALGGNIWTKN